jgi:hypothetical protein
MADPTEFGMLAIPARIADLACRMAAPRDWNVVELPPEEVDFSEPGAFFPLVMLTAPWAMVVLTVAARPAFEDGTLQDWCLYLLNSQGIRPTAFGPVAVGALQGLGGAGRQEQEGTWLEIRFAFFEDGGRLVQVGMLAPEAIRSSLEGIWRTALASFELERPMGQSTPLGAGMGLMPEPAVEEEAEVGLAEIWREMATLVPPPEEEEEEEAAAAVVEELGSEPVRFGEFEMGYYARAAEAGTLDPEHPTNARLREQGVGLVPRVLAVDLAGRKAEVGAGAIGAAMEVALGWFVIDDGKRTLVLDPAGKIQISLEVMATAGRGVEGILDAIEAEARASYGEPEIFRMEDRGFWTLTVREIVVDGEVVEQVHLLSTGVRGAGVVRARVTADLDGVRWAEEYARLILRSAESAGLGLEEEGEEEAEEEPVEGPPWWRRAVQLEQADRLEEAERLVKESIPSLHFAIQTAELYRRRWLRLRKAEPEKAGAARQKAADWAWQYASYATSGGEGAALSMERDEFVRTLGPEPLD